MLSQIAAAGLLAQSLLVPVSGYTTPDGLLATAAGQYAITWGHNCDGIGLGQNVAVWWVLEVPDQAALSPVDDQGNPVPIAGDGMGGVASQLCSVLLQPLSDAPCALDAQGQCDIADDVAALAPQS